MIVPDGPAVRTDSMAPELASRLASVLLSGVQRLKPGDALPALWQWGYFSGAEPMEALGADGHPRRDDPWAERFPRRMVGGGSVRGLAPFLIGELAERHSTLSRAEERQGRSGPLVICDWHHTYVQRGRAVLEETQKVIYRLPASSDDVKPRSRRDEPRQESVSGGVDDDTWIAVRRLQFDLPLLFRFSAATYNSHRIHYDLEYATIVEGYPGLVVQGPLLAMLLAREAENVVGEAGAIEFRAHAPVFDSDAIEIYFRRNANSSCSLQARKDDGTVAMSLRATASANQEQ